MTYTVTVDFVFIRDVLHKQLNDSLILPGSNAYDIPLCVCVMDVDFDGQNELLVGTYGQVSWHPLVTTIFKTKHPVLPSGYYPVPWKHNFDIKPQFLGVMWREDSNAIIFFINYWVKFTKWQNLLLETMEDNIGHNSKCVIIIKL